MVVGMIIGYNRSEHGNAAGMRTTLLVCLAASVAMIQVNLLLPTAGRSPNSFIMNDLMRLPLGILTGVGFIGGGVILRRKNLVVGVTTAATLWLVTVIGLCLGGGQIALGLAATALGLFALWTLSYVESRMRREHRARLSIELDATGPSEAEIRRRIVERGFTIDGTQLNTRCATKRRKFVLEVRRLRLAASTETPSLIEELATAPGVARVDWDGRG